jgi:hypothetical protein
VRSRLALLLASLALASCAPLPGSAPPAPDVSQQSSPVRRTPFSKPHFYTGLGFDACSAPLTTTMSSWLASPYRAIGIYIGGNSRACSQPNLTPSWITTVEGQGWSLLPLYVGSQAPAGCTGMVNFSHRISTSTATAASQGTNEADDAANQALNLGLGANTPIYFDLEAYTRNTACSMPVNAFVKAWAARLHARGYLAGFYSSSASGMADQAAFVFGDPSYLPPDDIWFANWNDNTSLFGDPYIPDGYWAFHQRHHQYHGGHNETYGGIQINIDNDSSDGAAASAPSGVRRTPSGFAGNGTRRTP